MLLIKVFLISDTACSRPRVLPISSRQPLSYHKVDKVVSGVTVVDELVVDDDEVLDGAAVVVSEQDVVRPEVSVRESMQGTRWGVLWGRMK